jgi:RNA polymerase sigma factor (sigma-70 family)
MDPQTFRETLERARQGDPRATAELMRTYGPGVRQVARARLKPFARRHVDSEDVQQSVFRRFFRRLFNGPPPRFDGPEHLANYLARATVNRTKDQHKQIMRAERGRVELLPEEFAELPVRLPETPARWQEVLDVMTPEERQIAQWRAEEYTWQEIAAKLGQPLSGVYQRFMRRLGALLGA